VSKEIEKALIEVPQAGRNYSVFLDSLFGSSKDIEKEFGMFFGLERAVQGINQRDPGTIEVVIEPQRRETFMKFIAFLEGHRKFEDARTEKDKKKMIRTSTEKSKALLEHAIGRDWTVFKLAKAAAEQDPDRAIIIPRGWAHMGMVEKFFANCDLFDIEVKINDVQPAAMGNAFVKSYKEPLSEREWHRVSEYDLYYHEYMNNLVENSYLLALLASIWPNYSIRWLERRATRYADSVYGSALPGRNGTKA
jgi:hypothetical protein